MDRSHSHTEEYMIGGFANYCISPEVFEKYFYNNLEYYENKLDNEIFMRLLSLDYSDKKSVTRMIVNLSFSYSNKIYNDAFFEKTENIILSEAYNSSQPDLSEINIDLTNIKSLGQFYDIILTAFHLNDMGSYCGRNLNAVNDLLDISDTKIIIINGFDKLENFSHKTAEYFLEIISKHKPENCIIKISP